MTPIFEDTGKLVGFIQFKNGLCEAWKRVRIAEMPSNSLKFVGRFESFDDSISALKIDP